MITFDSVKTVVFMIASALIIAMAICLFINKILRNKTASDIISENNLTILDSIASVYEFYLEYPECIKFDKETLQNFVKLVCMQIDMYMTKKVPEIFEDSEDRQRQLNRFMYGGVIETLLSTVALMYENATPLTLEEIVNKYGEDESEDGIKEVPTAVKNIVYYDSKGKDKTVMPIFSEEGELETILIKVPDNFDEK